MSEVSLSRALLIFYLIISSGYTKDLYSGQLKDYIMENRFAQHLIGFIIMLVVINSLSGINEPQRIIMYSLLAYVWFVLTTKLDLQWSLIIIALLTIGYLYESKLIGNINESKDDKSLKQEDIERIKHKNTQITNTITISIVVVTIIGSLLYMTRKSNQYGGNFDLGKFFFDGKNQN